MDLVQMKKKKVLLFKIPNVKFPHEKEKKIDLRVVHAWTRPLISTALGMLGAFLQEYAGDYFDVELVDISIDQALDSKQGTVEPRALRERMELFFRNGEYDVIGLSTMFLQNDEWTHLAAKLSKEYHPSAPIILGGGYATIKTEAALINTKADYAVIGEGEDTLLYILNKMFGIQNPRFDLLFPDPTGYAFWENSRVIIKSKTTFINNLDLLPWPAWDLLNGEKYFSKVNSDASYSYYPLAITRGCPYKCMFCSASQIWGRKTRSRSPEKVLEEIHYFYKKYNFKRLIFTDDDVNVNTNLFHSVLRGLIARNYGIGLETFYVAINPLRKETIQLMAEAGMKNICMPVETGSPRMQKVIKKFIDLNKAEQAFQWAKEYGFHTETPFIFGFPQETEEDRQMSIDFSRKIHAHSTIYLTATPWEGTELYDYAAANNYLPDELSNQRGSRDLGNFVNVDFDYAELKQILYDENIRMNFLTKIYLNEPENYCRLLKLWKSFEIDLPDHAILYLCLGFLSKKMDQIEEMERYYKRAYELFKKDDVNETYGRYLQWQEQPILDYLSFIATTTKVAGMNPTTDGA